MIGTGWLLFQHLRNSIPSCIFLSFQFWQVWQHRISYHQFYTSLSLFVSRVVYQKQVVSLAKAHWISVSTSQKRDLYGFFITWYSQSNRCALPSLHFPSFTCTHGHLQINTIMLLKLYPSHSQCLPVCVLSLQNSDDFKSELREQLPLIAGSAAAGVVFIVSLVAISIVCSR